MDGKGSVAAATTTVTSVVVDGWPFSPVTVLVILEVYEVVDLMVVDEVVDVGVDVDVDVGVGVGVGVGEVVLLVDPLEVGVEAVEVPLVVVEVVPVLGGVGVLVTSLVVVVDGSEVGGGVERVEVVKVVLFD